MRYGQVKAFYIIALLIYSLLFFTGGCNRRIYDHRGIQKTESPSSGCPIARLKETEDDCPWAAITRRMIAVDDSEYTIKEILERYSPGLLKAIIKDAQKDNLKNVWGKSINYNEMKKDIIVKPSILNTLLKLAMVPAPAAGKQHNGMKVIAHAGIVHTYGYLFSNLLTSYGYKRARWVRDDIEAGFELQRGILGPQPSSGTLFSNITYFISNIAFQSEPQILSKLNELNAPAVLKNFNYKNLKIRRLKERVDLQQNRTIILRTDLVEFIEKQEGRPNDYLLIYSFLDSSEKTPLLITTFPVSSGFVKGLFKISRLGENKLIKTRYNAFISGFTDSGTSHRGSRKEVK